MAKFELNIYGANDEILKTHKTDHVRWGLLMRALSLQEEIKDADPEAQLNAVHDFVKEIFYDMTDEDLKNADSGDVINVVTQVSKMAGKIKAKNA